MGSWRNCTFTCARLSNVNLQSRLDPVGQSAEIGDALQLIVRQFYMKVVLKLGEQVERLQTIDLEGLEEIVIGCKLCAGNLEVYGGQIQDFFKRVFSGGHDCLSPKMGTTGARKLYGK